MQICMGRSRRVLVNVREGNIEAGALSSGFLSVIYGDYGCFSEWEKYKGKEVLILNRIMLLYLSILQTYLELPRFERV